MKRTCSVCIATYKRPGLLERLLDSLADQALPEDVELELLVVDNDPDGSAESVCSRFRDLRGADIRYFLQPVKNISLTRNVAVEKARGEFLLFIDDDESAVRNWVASLLAAMETFGADGVFGRVIPEFPEQTPEWIMRSILFDKPCLPTGATASHTRTSNALIKASLLKGLPGPFDPAYGLTGGEDTHLFEKLRRKGAKFISCREAIVSESIPRERACLRWMVKRAYRGGNTYARRLIEGAEASKAGRRMSMLIQGAGYSLVGLLLMLASLPIVPWSSRWAVKTAANLGKTAAAFGFHIEEYR
jgi:succinoglycan biosynthesis protein ExoM